MQRARAKASNTGGACAWLAECGCAQVTGYAKLIEYWMEEKYTLRYTGGLVPDICQQFTKGMGVFANPTSKASPAKLRLAFEAAPFGYLVEKVRRATSSSTPPPQRVIASARHRLSMSPQHVASSPCRGLSMPP